MQTFNTSRVQPGRIPHNPRPHRRRSSGTRAATRPETSTQWSPKAGLRAPRAESTKRLRKLATLLDLIPLERTPALGRVHASGPAATGARIRGVATVPPRTPAGRKEASGSAGHAAARNRVTAAGCALRLGRAVLGWADRVDSRAGTCEGRGDCGECDPCGCDRLRGSGARGRGLSATGARSGWGAGRCGVAGRGGAGRGG